MPGKQFYSLLDMNRDNMFAAFLAGNNIGRRTNIKGKGPQGDDQSYQVMLESCVLQLVCVQKKVQLEALTEGSV